MIRTPSNSKTWKHNFIYINWVEIEHKCNKLTESNARVGSQMTRISVLIN